MIGRKTGRIDDNAQLHLEGHKPKIYRSRRFYVKRGFKWSVLILIFILVLLFAGGFVWLKAKESQMKMSEVESSLDPVEKGEPINTLVLGIDRGSADSRETQGRSDIIMILGTSGDGKKTCVISIPRDSRVKIPGRNGLYKINAAYAYEGPSLAISTVRTLTGLKIHHFIVIDFEGFKRIVDAVGGVRMYIEKEINDKYAGHVPAGDQVLDGTTALALVRARHDPKSVPGGDFDRMKHQREFLKAMLRTVAHQRNPLKIKGIIDAIASSMKTDLSFFDMFFIGRKINGSGVEMTTAPGEAKVIGSTWYFILDQPRLEEILRPFQEGYVSSGDDRDDEENQSRLGIRVFVLNGTEVVGLASRFAESLSEKGYNVLGRGNAKSPYEKTTIYFSGSNEYMARMIAQDLSLANPSCERHDKIVGNFSADVVVVIGTDIGGKKGY